MMGHHPGGLPGNRFPGRPGVGRAIERGPGGHADPDVDRRCGAARRAAALDRRPRTSSRSPCLAVPDAPPLAAPVVGKPVTCVQVCAKSVLFHRPALREPKYKVLVRLGSMASRSPIERPSTFPPMGAEMLLFAQVCPMSVELRIEAVAGREVLPGGHVDPVGIDRIRGDALDPGEVGIVVPDPIGDGHPALPGRVETVGAADISPCEDEPRKHGAHDDAADEAATLDDDVLPQVRPGSGRVFGRDARVA